MESHSQGIVSRPAEVIDALSRPQQWEATRRHPYYLSFWQSASIVDEPHSELERVLSDAARFMLMAIGYVGPPQPPAKSAEELGITAQTGPWKEGAISRVTVRSLVVTLAGRLLPAETKRKIAELLLKSCDVDMQTPSEEHSAFVRDLTQGRHLHFDDSLPELFVLINPYAPGRSAGSAVQKIIRDFKKERGIPEKRRRAANFDDYLRVWDLREGWTGEGYDVSRELRLKEIAKQLKISISTSANRYRSAFRYIVGHDYDAALWLRVVGLPKLLGFFGSELPRASRKRPRVERRPRDVPISVLQKTVDSTDGRHLGILESNCPTFGNLEDAELLMDVRTLIDRGRNNEQIVAELNLQSARAEELIEYLRSHGDERL